MKALKYIERTGWMTKRIRIEDLVNHPGVKEVAVEAAPVAIPIPVMSLITNQVMKVRPLRPDIVTILPPSCLVI